jgi:phenylacetate-CoA ligase
MPLIRYRSSDLTRLIDGECECGIRMGRVAKIRRRYDQMVVGGMGNVGPWVFAELLSRVVAAPFDPEWARRIAS